MAHRRAGHRLTAGPGPAPEGGWLPIIFGDRPGPAGGLRVAAKADPYAGVRDIQATLRTLEA